MKKIVTLLLLVAMLITAIPVMVWADAEAPTESTAFDAHELYVKEGLVSLFTVFDDAADVDLSRGIWHDRVGGKTATLGNASRWQVSALGGVGFDTFCGEMAGGTFSAASAGNNFTDKSARLEFGTALLPTVDFTVEYMAMYKPVYLYDAASADGIARDESGRALETYDFSPVATTNHATLGPIDYVGYLPPSPMRLTAPTTSAVTFTGSSTLPLGAVRQVNGLAQTGRQAAVLTTWGTCSKQIT